MLHYFDPSKPLFRFPKRWANAVTAWLTGIVSPDGTLDITNSPNPTDGNGPSISVNPGRTFSAIRGHIAGEFLRKNAFSAALNDEIDGHTIVFDGNAVGVSSSWLESVINSMKAQDVVDGSGGSGGSGTWCCRLATDGSGSPSALYFGSDADLTGTIAQVESRASVTKVETITFEEILEDLNEGAE